MNILEVLFTPAEFAALANRDLSRTVCVVFDILRATSSIITALSNGAVAILPVAEISDAVAARINQPDVLLAGERNGVRPSRDLTGGIEFDLGNSPREFTPERVRGKTIVMTTTNGTRAIRACRGASVVFVGAFLNMNALANSLSRSRPANILVICSGTHEEASYEDALAAGALCQNLWDDFKEGQIADSAHIAHEIYLRARGDLLDAMRYSRNARRLFGIPELAHDVPYCLESDKINIVATVRTDGTVSASLSARSQV